MDDPKRLCRVCERPAGLHDGDRPYPCPEPGDVLECFGGAALLRISKIQEEEGKIALPGKSAEANQFHVVKVGPDAAGWLCPGDRVIAAGPQEVDWHFVPGFPRLLVVRDARKTVLFRWRREGE